MKRYRMNAGHAHTVESKEHEFGQWVDYQDALAHAATHGTECARAVLEGANERYQQLMDRYMALKAHVAKTDESLTTIADLATNALLA